MHPHIGHLHNAMPASIKNKKKEMEMAKQYGTSLEGLAGKGLNQTFMPSSCTGSVRSSPSSCVVNSGTIMSGMKKIGGSMFDEYVCR